MEKLNLLNQLKPKSYLRFEERGLAMAWLSWTIPLLITEIALSWKKK